jgi:hypothetical protein
MLRTQTPRPPTDEPLTKEAENDGSWPRDPSQTPQLDSPLAIGDIAEDGETRLEDGSLLSSVGRALSVRLAYGTFFAVQSVAAVCNLTASRLSSEFEAFSLLSFPNVVALGAIFMVARDLSTESGLGANIAVTFWFHNLISLACSVYKVSRVLRGNGFCIQSRGFEFIMSALYLFWVICGTGGVLKSSIRRTQLVE